jgi:Family of unknown function (DUF6519)
MIMGGDITRSTFHPEKHYSAVRKQQGRVDLDADWNEQGDITAHRVDSETVDVIGTTGAPQNNPGFGLQVVNNTLVIGAGHFYLDGILCENEQAVAIAAQPDLPGFTLPTKAGSFLAYLHVWERTIIALQDSAIREVALGGPDTCTRLKTVWQVNLLPAPATDANQQPLGCGTKVAAWDGLVAASTGTLAARSQPDLTSSDPCLVPSRAGYRRLENQLYRVEIHDNSNAQGGATFKWSRDNGSVVTRLITLSGVNLTVSSTGPDAALGFSAGQWVEITDDTHELDGNPGTLVQIVKVAGQTLTVDSTTATGSLNQADFPLNPLVRRWDSAGRIAVSTNWTDLEDGVQVQFAAGILKTGDFWLIPARTATADVEWPRDTANNPLPQTPKGIIHHFTRLAIVQFDGQLWHLISDCRAMFPPLTSITSGVEPGIHITDVRSNRPDAPLPNDSLVPLDELMAGFSLICDAPVSPDSVKQPTCFVALDIPYPLGITQQSTDFPVVGFVSVKLPGNVTALTETAGNRIVWIPSDPKGAFFFLNSTFATMTKLNRGDRILGRLIAKGNFIWGLNNPALFLDGEVFGSLSQEASGSTTKLQLPSGNGRRGGDFETWFWILAPIALTGFTLSAQTVVAGGTLAGTVTLNEQAPSSGAVVSLSASVLDASGAPVPGVQVVTMPATVTVAASSNTGTFKIQAGANAAGATVTVTATAGVGTISQSFRITPRILVPVIPPTNIANR